MKKFRFILFTVSLLLTLLFTASLGFATAASITDDCSTGSNLVNPTNLFLATASGATAAYIGDTHFIRPDSTSTAYMIYNTNGQTHAQVKVLYADGYPSYTDVQFYIKDGDGAFTQVNYAAKSLSYPGWTNAVYDIYFPATTTQFKILFTDTATDISKQCVGNVIINHQKQDDCSTTSQLVNPSNVEVVTASGATAEYIGDTAVIKASSTSPASMVYDTQGQTHAQVKALYTDSYPSYTDVQFYAKDASGNFALVNYAKKTLTTPGWINAVYDVYFPAATTQFKIVFTDNASDISKQFIGNVLLDYVQQDDCSTGSYLVAPANLFNETVSEATAAYIGDNAFIRPDSTSTAYMVYNTNGHTHAQVKALYADGYPSYTDVQFFAKGAGGNFVQVSYAAKSTTRPGWTNVVYDVYFPCTTTQFKILFTDNSSDISKQCIGNVLFDGEQQYVPVTLNGLKVTPVNSTGVYTPTKYDVLSVGGVMVGMWVAPPAAQTTEMRFKEIKDSGINVITGISGPSVSSILSALDAAQANGMKYLVYDDNVNQMIANYMSTNNSSLLTSIVNAISAYSTHPAYAGQYLYDEPGKTQFDALNNVIVAYKNAFPGKFAHVNLFPTYATGGIQANNYDDYINTWFSKNKLNYVSYDHYPLLENGVTNDYFKNLSLLRDKAAIADIPLHTYIQTLSFTSPGLPSRRTPSETDIRWQVYSSLTFGAKAIQYFAYWTPVSATETFGQAMISIGGYKTQQYGYVQKVNNEVRELGKILASCKSMGIIRNTKAGDAVIALNSTISSYAPITGLTGDSALLGCFEGPNGEKKAMLLNSSCTNPAAVKISLNGSVNSCYIWIGGKRYFHTVNNNELNISLGAGEGVLIEF